METPTAIAPAPTAPVRAIPLAPGTHHAASMTYDPEADNFVVRCLEPGCPMSAGGGFCVKKPHSMYRDVVAPHRFAKMSNWAEYTSIKTTKGGFVSIATLAARHHRLGDGRCVTRSNTTEIRAFLAGQLNGDVPCVVDLCDGAATIKYKVNTKAKANSLVVTIPPPVAAVTNVRKRRIVPEPMHEENESEDDSFIVNDGDVVPDHARPGLNAWKEGMRSMCAAIRLAAERARAASGDGEGETEAEAAEEDGGETETETDVVAETEPLVDTEAPGAVDAGHVGDKSESEIEIEIESESESRRNPTRLLAEAIFRATARTVALLADSVDGSRTAQEVVRTNIALQKETLDLLYAKRP